MARLEIIAGGRRRGSLLVLKSDIRDIARGFRRLSQGATNRAVRKSLNQAIRKTNTQAKRAIADKRNIRIGDVGRSLRVVTARTGFEAEIVGTGRPISLMQLRTQPVQLKPGVRVTAERGKGRTLLRGAFITRMPAGKGGRHGVFQRKEKPRLPIREHTLPSVAHTLVQKDIAEPLREHAHGEFRVRLKANLDRELGRLPGATGGAGPAVG